MNRNFLFTSNDGKFISNSVASADQSDHNKIAVWSTKKVEDLLHKAEIGELEIRGLKNTPFKENNPALKKPFLVFEYTPEELEEYRKCKANPLYFANTYAHSMTPNGIQQITLRDYQEEILGSFKNNFKNILMASRQIGKSVISGIFIVWFLLFHADKNALVVADNATTTKEIIDKMKTVIEHLPFFLKPGMVSNNVMSMNLDNGSRLIGRTTTKKTGIGFTINLLYIDEFAHIDDSYLRYFYRSIYPTITEDPEARIIITSTPNGQNMFWEMYMNAVEGNSGYTALRVDWWQVEGRDDEWRRAVIAELGSVEDFNQEYGIQFFSADTLLLSSKDLEKMMLLKTKYTKLNFALSEEMDYINEFLSFHPKFAKMDLTEIRNDKSNYIFSIDTADGVGRDYSVINIFKIIPLSIAVLLKNRDHVKNELDMFSLVQVGQFRTNEINLNSFSKVVEYIAYDIFNPEKVRIVLEMNYKGEIVKNRLEKNSKYWIGQIVSSKHTGLAENAETEKKFIKFKPGLKLNPANKIKYCERFRYYLSINKIIPNANMTVMELGAFGKTKSGTSYRSQTGHDDLSMTCVNASSFFSSPQFYEICSEMYDELDPHYKQRFLSEILDINSTVENKRLFNPKDVQALNETFAKGSQHNSQNRNSVFDLDTLRRIREAAENFRKS